ncbi:MAG: DUF4157 domain-containing protein [Acaryochloridaceae cyanobacterium RU_4_10]|nr:DUF4157 domain-containing protein [Acaryochloridaceae cyanobacterium RU_4_10]
MHDLQKMLEMAQRSGHHWANISASSSPSSFAIQPKLAIGVPGDKYEQEVDRVAHQVVQQLNASKLERAEPEQSIQRESLSEEEDKLQMKPMAVKSSNGLTDAPAELEGAIDRARGNGQPLADSIRQPMEEAFGADFSGVKLHTDSQADQLNRSVQARAFTTGQDVFFRQGEYNPGSRGGQELIAHELTHVVQQDSEQKGGVPIVRQEGTTVLRAKRQVPQEEWTAWKNKNKSSKVEALEKKPVNDIELGEIDKVYDKYKNGAKTKFENGEKKEVVQQEAVNAGENTSKGSPVARHTFKEHYNILAVLTCEDRYRKKERKTEKNVNVVKVIATRNPEAKNWKAYHIKGMEAKGEDTVQYTGRYYPAQGKYFADENFKDRDLRYWGSAKEKGTQAKEVGQYGAPEPNSDIIYAMYQLAKVLAEREKDRVAEAKGLQKIRRHHIINADTLITMMQCDQGKVSIEFKNKGELIGEGQPNSTEDDYWALLGTPNGQAAGYIALQHTKTEEGEKGVTQKIGYVKYKESELTIPIKDIQ